MHLSVRCVAHLSKLVIVIWVLCMILQGIQSSPHSKNVLIYKIKKIVKFLRFF